MSSSRPDSARSGTDVVGSRTSSDETDHVYAISDGEQLLARIYKRDVSPSAGAPVVIDVHGGHWSHGDRLAGHVYDKALADEGFAVVAVDFRQAPRHRHPAASADVVSAIRWVCDTADRFGFDPSRVGLVGSSSGGHLALLAACRLGGPEYADPEHEVEDPAVACVAALWSPVDPYRRYRFALEQLKVSTPEISDRYRALVAGSLDYFGSEQRMIEASIARLVAEGEALALPPLWLCHAGEDLNVPRPILDDLADEWSQPEATSR